ncbi:MAG: hypothetical protein GWP36_05955 [Bacteroidetes bacterium]|jgi:4-amino-4-deoxy-L-arabinose transferase-like glycosyltransferase|nr:hypothetical protein [Bacteroidota bacterium]
MNATKATSDSMTDSGWNTSDKLVLALLLALTILRSIVIFLSPLELGVDEAQYWLWSQTFEFGYFTKPPLTSWIIGSAHATLGHHIWAIRLPAPWLHLITALVLWRAAFWIGGPVTGRRAGHLASLLWISLPAVAIGSFVISTDTPMLLFWSLGLLALTGVIVGKVSPRAMMLFAGGAFGAAMLAKYAAIYSVLGLVLFFCLDRIYHRQKHLSLTALVLFSGGMILVASPNLVWNLTHDFTTVRHLGDNANLDQQSYSLINSLEFIAAQFATAGPFVFLLMLGIMRPNRGANPDHVMPVNRLLLCMSAPIIAIIALQAFLSEANANWALAAMPALVLWLASWLAKLKPTRFGYNWPANLAIGVNIGLAAVFLIVSWTGSLAIVGPLAPSSDPLRRLRGWEQLAADTAAVLDKTAASAVIANSRAAAALLSWHFHDRNIEILVHDADGVPSNHFEANLAWQQQRGRRLVALHSSERPPVLPNIQWDAENDLSDVRISVNRTRRLFISSGVEAD